MWHSNKWLNPKHWLFPTAADMYYNIYRQLFPSTKTIKKRRGHMGLGLNVWVMIQKLGNCVCFMNVVLLCMICNDMGAPGRELKCSRGARLLPQPCQATLQPNNFEILQSFNFEIISAVSIVIISYNHVLSGMHQKLTIFGTTRIFYSYILNKWSRSPKKLPENL